MSDALEQIIVHSWTKNAGPWIKAIRNGEVVSRETVTNDALLEAIRERSPQTVLDLGCGEGWLARELAPQGIDVLGIEVVEEMFDAAMSCGVGRYACVNYDDVSLSQLEESFDLIVANFSLIGKSSVEQMFSQLPALLNSKGALIVQSLHPVVIADDEPPYEDGWRMGTWEGFNDSFTDPAPWFFRTIESWQELFETSGFSQIDIYEPVNPKTGDPASILFIASE